MAENQHIYAAIDLKSFYASVECVSRKLDTLTTNLVVADVTRSEKTICLAVSPSLKACGIPGRPRLFEVVQKVREVNRQRLADAVRAHKAVRGADGKWSFASSSFDAAALQKDLSLELGYIVAPPRMATYIEYSTRIYQIYLKYVAPEDIHVYSIDEVFIDLTHYLPFSRMTAHELVTTMIRETFTPPASRPRRASAPTCIWPRPPWTLWPSTFPPIKTGCASPNWTSRPTAKRCGDTPR